MWAPLRCADSLGLVGACEKTENEKNQRKTKQIRGKREKSDGLDFDCPRALGLGIFVDRGKRQKTKENDKKDRKMRKTRGVGV